MPGIRYGSDMPAESRAIPRVRLMHCVCIVGSIRRRAVIVARLTVVIIACTHVAAAIEPAHILCALAEHGCHSTAVTAPCCCGGESQASRPAGPIAHVYRAITALAVAPAALPQMVPISAEVAEPARTRTSAASPPDIVILLANLRL